MCFLFDGEYWQEEEKEEVEDLVAFCTFCALDESTK